MYPTQQLRRLARIRNGADHSGVQDDLGDFPVYGSGGEFTRATRSLYSGPAVLLGRKGTIDRPILVDGEFWTVDTIFCAQPHPEVDAAFLYYACTTIPFSLLSTSTALPSMTQGDLNAVRLPAPTYEVQQAIASFLDRETAKIDVLIAKQEQLITTLREDRAATITQAVTKGLDPNAEMKNTGIGWLGSVPAHWKLIPLRYLYAKRKDQDHPDKQLLSIYRDYGVVPKDSRTDNFNKASADLSYYQLVEHGDLVVNRMKAWQGSVGISRYRGIISPDYYVYKPLHDQFDGFLNYLFRCQRYAAGYGRLSTGVRPSQWSITPGDHLGMEALLPPIEEQIAIAEFLDARCVKIDALIDKSTEMIETLCEYRSALITDAVTGKIDVRGEPNHAATP
ncbi:restriction endonuclease subunit S [Rhodococcus sp. LW-XY12]|uniref:restriction endonuclease subunit S n=1 Tax=Rhodococcus sp. LW-XY12 TaxID=2856851 RepID=UPI001C598C14|nr:restriction endonuclease subunit S [Rhodococcus sp. LW-XY12]QXU56658.1 restriction endonuclease subunit S [Rhodococcus sp. LW-XY12]